MLVSLLLLLLLLQLRQLLPLLLLLLLMLLPLLLLLLLLLLLQWPREQDNFEAQFNANVERRREERRQKQANQALKDAKDLDWREGEARRVEKEQEMIEALNDANEIARQRVP